MHIKALGALSRSTSEMCLIEMERRDCGGEDVVLDIKFCGICHTDLHFKNHDIGNHSYPLVTGHEIIGKVTDIGGRVTEIFVGDFVGVGCMSASCVSCTSCVRGEQFCADVLWMYGGTNKKVIEQTVGGHSNKTVIDRKFVIHFPFIMDELVEKDDTFLEKCASLLCASIILSAPLQKYIEKEKD